MRRKLTEMSLAAAIVALIVIALPASQTYAHPDYGCESCHVPHNAYADDTSVPLWNPEHVDTTLTGGYDSPTMQASDNAQGPNGASRLCLSCHDGTTFSMGGGDHNDAFFGAGGGMGESLATSHPISFTYDTALATADGELKDPATNPDVAAVLDSQSRMQCISCHDVHSTAADYGTEESHNLRWPYDNVFGQGAPQFNNAAFCRHCHLK